MISYKQLYDLSKKEKVLQNLTKLLQFAEEDRFYPNYQMLGTETGRFTASKPEMMPIANPTRPDSCTLYLWLESSKHLATNKEKNRPQIDHGQLYWVVQDRIGWHTNSIAFSVSHPTQS